MKNQDTQSLALKFNNTKLTPIVLNNQLWLTSVELSKALGYSQENAITKIFNRCKDEFTDSMSVIMPLTQIGSLVEFSGLQREQRLFSLRGCHLIAFFARTTIAKDFRKWVLDILDQHTEHNGLKSSPISAERHPITVLEQALEKHLHNFAETSGLSHSTMNECLRDGLFTQLKVSSFSELTVEQMSRAIVQLEKADAMSKELKLYIMHICTWLLFGLTSNTDYYSGLPSGVTASIRGMYRA